jgi:diguanylate cyclase (GGDEF)-like protein
MRILVVEDDAVSARIIELRAQRAGHTCVVVPDGQTAWETLQIDPSIDAILSGWFQPGLGGMELCTKVRDFKTRFVPFIFVTALEDRHLQLEGMRAGAVGYLTKPIDRHELAMQLIAAERFLDLHRALARRTEDLRRLNAEFYAQGRQDALTGIPNRLCFDEETKAVHARVRSQHLGYALAMVDIDHFKSYNDALGHQAGDEALYRVAQRLLQSLRTTDRIYRYGGEEFCVVVQTHEPVIAAQVMQRLRRQVEQVAIPHPEAPAGVITVSLGYALYDPAEDPSFEVLLHRADQALYEAKHRGRNQVVAWTEGMDDPLIDSLADEPTEISEMVEFDE